MMKEKIFWGLFHENGDKEPEDPPKEEKIYLDMFQKIDMSIIMLKVISDKLGMNGGELYKMALDMVRKRNEG